MYGFEYVVFRIIVIEYIIEGFNIFGLVEFFVRGKLLKEIKLGM